jgi:hypothetical protein
MKFRVESSYSASTETFKIAHEDLNSRAKYQALEHLKTFSWHMMVI